MNGPCRKRCCLEVVFILLLSAGLALSSLVAVSGCSKARKVRACNCPAVCRCCDCCMAQGGADCCTCKSDCHCCQSCCGSPTHD